MGKDRISLGATAVLVSLFTASLAFAEVKTITATGEYRMGDNDTRTDAKRLALLDAKRLALEQAGTYLESVTEVKNLKVSHDELRAYTAGIVEVIEQSTRDVMEGATHIIRVEVTAKIDTEVVARQIDALRKNETARAELLRLRAEDDRLRHELEAKSRELAAQKSKTEVERATKERQLLLRRQDVLDIVRRGTDALFEGVRLRGGYEGASITLGLSKSLSKSHGLSMVDRNGRRLSPEEAEKALAGLKEEFLKAMGKARGLAEQALAFGPSEPAAHGLMGNILLEEGDAISAVNEFRTALRLAESDTKDTVREFRTHPRVQELVAMHQKILAQHHFDLATALETTGDLSAAVEEFRIAAALNSESYLYHSALGKALEQSGELADALREYHIATRLEPNRWPAAERWSVPRTLAMLGEWDGAIREMRKRCPTRAADAMCVLGVDDASLATTLAMHLELQDSRTGAIAAARYAVRLEPRNHARYRQLANILDWAGDLPDASREYRAALQLKPDDGETHARLAVVLAEMGDVDGAIREARTSLHLEPAEGKAHFALGKALLAKGDKEAAAHEFKEYLNLVTSNPATQALLSIPELSHKSDKDLARIREAQRTLRDLGR